jgi:hypothetical protein
MLGALTILALAAKSPQVTFRDGSFVVQVADQTAKVAVAESAGPVQPGGQGFRMTFGERVVVFDAKGLGIGKGKQIAYSGLQAVATTPKLFSQGEIDATTGLVATGVRRLSASSLSGWERTGDVLVLLVRWTEKSGRPWLEALVRLDMAEERPSARLLGRFTGTSLAKGLADDRLAYKDGRYMALTNNVEAFGLSSLAADGTDPQFQRLGPAVGGADVSDDLRWAGTTRPTDYGTVLIGLADLQAGRHREVSEIRGKVAGFVSPAYARCQDGGRSVLINLLTGAEVVVRPDSGQKHTPFGLLLWAPRAKPQRAVLFDGHFRRLAEWSSPRRPR